MQPIRSLAGMKITSTPNMQVLNHRVLTLGSHGVGPKNNHGMSPTPWNLLPQAGGDPDPVLRKWIKGVRFNSFTHHGMTFKKSRPPHLALSGITELSPPFQRPTSSSLAPMAAGSAAEDAAASSCLRHSSVIFCSCFLARWIMQPTSHTTPSRRRYPLVIS